MSCSEFSAMKKSLYPKGFVIQKGLENHCFKWFFYIMEAIPKANSQYKLLPRFIFIVIVPVVVYAPTSLARHAWFSININSIFYPKLQTTAFILTSFFLLQTLFFYSGKNVYTAKLNQSVKCLAIF